MRRPSLTFFFGLAVLCLLTPNSARAQWGAGQCLVPGLSPAAVIELCEDALTIDPTHPEVLYKIGWALSEMGAHLDAVASYREAIRNQPNHPQAHFGLGKSLEKLGRFDEALAAFRDALRLNPENAAAKKRIESLSARIENQKKEEPSRALAAEKKDRKAEKPRKKAALFAERKTERRGESVSGHRKFAAPRPEKRARLDVPKSPKKTVSEGGTFRFAKGKVNKYAVAVIIGNRGYSKNSMDIPNVKYAHNDADAVYAYVTRALGYREGNIIRLRDATQAQLVSTFGTKENHRGRLNNWVRPGKSDAFVFYSSHGVPGLFDGRSYLLPVDADPATPQLNGYPLATLYANLAKLPARSVTVMLDACFSGGSAGGALVRSASSISVVARKPPRTPAGAVVLTAAGMNQVASWGDDVRLGLFTRYVLEGLAGAADRNEFGDDNGKVTLAELGKFLKEEMTYQARRRFGRRQTPELKGNAGRVLSTVR